jgi:hypothetical protein
MKLAERYSHYGFRLEMEGYQPYELYPLDPEGSLIVWFDNATEAAAWIEGYAYAIEQAEMHECGPLCPVHGDPRDTSIRESIGLTSARPTVAQERPDLT